MVDAITAGLPDANPEYSRRRRRSRRSGFNSSKFPFDSKAVRQAVGYSIDRDAIVNKLFGPLGVTKAVNSLNPFVVKDYSDPNAWAGYTSISRKVNSLMTGDGWTKGSDGIWVKDGQTRGLHGRDDRRQPAP